MIKFPENLNTELFKAIWKDWTRHRKEIHHTLKPTTIEYQLRKLSKLTEPEAIATIEQSIENGWQGIFPVKTEQKLKLWPIQGRTCSKKDCGMPAVYKETGGAYDYYSCTNHLPDKVKRQFV